MRLCDESGSYWLLTTKAKVQSQVKSYGIGDRDNFSLATLVYCCPFYQCFILTCLEELKQLAHLRLQHPGNQPLPRTTKNNSPWHMNEGIHEWMNKWYDTFRLIVIDCQCNFSLVRNHRGKFVIWHKI
jgi:hypothetical protein